MWSKAIYKLQVTIVSVLYWKVWISDRFNEFKKFWSVYFQNQSNDIKLSSNILFYYTQWGTYSIWKFNIYDANSLVRATYIEYQFHICYISFKLQLNLKSHIYNIIRSSKNETIGVLILLSHKFNHLKQNKLHLNCKFCENIS